MKKNSLIVCLTALACASNAMCMYDNNNTNVFNNDRDMNYDDYGNVEEFQGFQAQQQQSAFQGFQAQQQQPAFQGFQAQQQQPAFQGFQAQQQQPAFQGFQDQQQQPAFQGFQDQQQQPAPPAFQLQLLPFLDPLYALGFALHNASVSNFNIGVFIEQVNPQDLSNLLTQLLVTAHHAFAGGYYCPAVNILKPLYDYPALENALPPYKRAYAKYLAAYSLYLGAGPAAAATASAFSGIFMNELDQYIGRTKYNPANHSIESVDDAVETDPAVKALFLARAGETSCMAEDNFAARTRLKPLFEGDDDTCLADHLGDINYKTRMLNTLIRTYTVFPEDAHDYVLENRNRIRHTLSLPDVLITPTDIVTMKNNQLLDKEVASILLHIFDGLDDDVRGVLYEILKEAHHAATSKDYITVFKVLKPLVDGNDKLIEKLPTNEKVFVAALLTKASSDGDDYSLAATCSNYIISDNVNAVNALFASIGRFPDGFANNLLDINNDPFTVDEDVQKADFLYNAANAYAKKYNYRQAKLCLERLLFDKGSDDEYFIHNLHSSTLLPAIKLLIKSYNWIKIPVDAYIPRDLIRALLTKCKIEKRDGRIINLPSKFPTTITKFILERILND